MHQIQILRGNQCLLGLQCHFAQIVPGQCRALDHFVEGPEFFMASEGRPAAGLGLGSKEWKPMESFPGSAMASHGIFGALAYPQLLGGLPLDLL